jgi:cytochrome b pre-mRNA-processing protein 3
MIKTYMSFYNSLVEMTRNKDLYKNFKSQDEFSDRLVFFLIHLAFFFKVFKKEENTKALQEIYDFIFRQLELSIREIGYGDQSINKKMKNYLNLFHSLIDKIHYWNDLEDNKKTQIFDTFIENSSNNQFLTEYFNNYYNILQNNTLNSYLKSVVKT